MTVKRRRGWCNQYDQYHLSITNRSLKGTHNYHLANYRSRDQTQRSAYVTSFLAEGNQSQVTCTPNTLPTKYSLCQIMFIVRTVYASLSAPPRTALSPLNVASTGFRAQRFARPQHFYVHPVVVIHWTCNMQR